jgi:hypothetical protein
LPPFERRAARAGEIPEEMWRLQSFYRNVAGEEAEKDEIQQQNCQSPDAIDRGSWAKPPGSSSRSTPDECREERHFRAISAPYLV